MVSMDSGALDAARMLAEHRLPGILVTGSDGYPEAVLPAAQVVQFIIPRYVQDDPSLARVLDEPMCAKAISKLRGKTVRDVIPEKFIKIPFARADDTIIELAAVMAQYRSPLIAVLDGKRLLGVVTASRLLEAALRDSSPQG